MPQTQSQAGPQDFDYAKLPDGSYAKFAKGTPPEQMRARLTAAGLLKAQAAPQATSQQGATTRFVKGAYEGAKGVVKGTYEIGKDLLSNPNWAATMPPGQRPSTMQKFVTEPAQAEAAKAKEAFNAHRLLEAAGHGVAAALPLAGPWAAGIGEQMGKGDIAGGLGQLAGGLGAGKAIAKTGEATGDFVKPESLRQRAAELNTKVLKQAESGAKDYRTSSALQVAQENIVSNARQLPAKIEQVRVAKQAEVLHRAQAADAAGITIDITQDIKPILQDIASNANARGHWTPQLRNQIVSLLERVTMQTDMKTGQRIPRGIDKLTVSQTLELEKGLKDLSSFGKVAPTQIENLARRLRGAMNDKLPPDIQRLRAEESKLITARDAARDNWTQILNDKSSAGRGVLYKGTGPVAVYFGLKAIGLGGLSAPFLATVVLYKALASTPSRTLRAALYARAASLIDGAVGATGASAGPTKPLQASGGGTPGLVPQGPQSVAGQALTGQNTAQPRSAPFAPASVVSTNEPAVTRQPVRGTELPASATRARAGSGDYVKKSKAQADTEFFNKHEAKAAEKTEFFKKEEARQGVAQSNTVSKNKAMLDRLDSLLERQAKPKSAMDNAAIQREIAEVKKLLAGENLGTKHAGAPKRIADRERLAEKRAQAAATSPVQTTGAGGEPVAQTASPELRSIALDAGYKKLATYEGGATMVKALRDTAKAMQKLDPSYDEVEQLTNALNILKDLPKGD